MGKIKKGNKLVSWGIGAAVCIALPFILSLITGNTYLVMILSIAEVYIIAVTGLDILFGYSGQISMGHAAFFTIGAYTSGLLDIYFGLPLWLCTIAGCIVPTIIGTLLAIPASRLKFHFLSLSTIAFGEITYYFLYVSPGGFTKDYKGINVQGISLLTDAAGNQDYMKWYFFLLVFVVIIFIFKTNLIKSKTGRSFIAIRENTHAADGMGVDVRKMKVLAFSISAFLVGFAGTMYIRLIKYISPESAQQKQSVLFLTMLLFGGTASIPGTITGVLVIEFLMELIRPLQEYQMLIYGIMLLIVIVALPGGLWGGFVDIFNSIKNRKAKGGKESDK